MQESLSMDMNASDTMIPPASAFRMNQGNPTPICEIEPVGQSKLELMGLPNI